MAEEMGENGLNVCWMLRMTTGLLYVVQSDKPWQVVGQSNLFSSYSGFIQDHSVVIRLFQWFGFKNTRSLSVQMQAMRPFAA